MNVPWIEPKRPDAFLISLIHRSMSERHTIHFARKVVGEEKEWQPLCNIRADDLQSCFPEIAEALCRDSFFSINGFLPPKGKSPIFPSQLAPGRHSRLAHCLTSCFVDVDCYGEGRSREAAFGAVFAMAGDGRIPQWSVMVDSGQGFWLFWLLRDPKKENNTPIAAYPDNQYRWRRIQRRIGEALRSIGGDRNAADVSRVTRVAGGINTKTIDLSKVRYHLVFDGEGQWIYHTLDSLEESLGIRGGLRIAALQGFNAADPVLSCRGLRGSLGRWAWEFRRLQFLEGLRDGWPDGCRHHGLFYTCAALLRVRGSVRAVLKRGDKGRPLPDALLSIGEMSNMQVAVYLVTMAKRCRPPLPLADVASIATGLHLDRSSPDRAKKHATQLTMADSLKVQPWEIDSMEEAGLGRWPVPGVDGPQIEPPISERKESAKERRAAIVAIIEESAPDFPTLRALRLALLSQGIQATKRTIANDLEAIGILNPRSREGKRLEVDRRGEGSERTGALFPE